MHFGEFSHIYESPRPISTSAVTSGYVSNRSDTLDELVFPDRSGFPLTIVLFHLISLILLVIGLHPLIGWIPLIGLLPLIDWIPLVIGLL